MKRHLIKIFTIIFFCLGLGTCFALPTFAESSQTTTQETEAEAKAENEQGKDLCKRDDVSDAIKKAAGCKTETELKTVVTNIIKVVIGVSGIVAVIFVIIGGIQYMTSTGDPGKVEKAKKTILYALIGLAVCALSFVIVNWAANVINNSDTIPADNKDKASCEEAGFTWKNGTCQ